jgi:hypothetical protein
MSELLQVSTISAAQARLTVLFVHGLGGDKRATWCADGAAETFWPGWLAADLPTVSIYTLEKGKKQPRRKPKPLRL